MSTMQIALASQNDFCDNAHLVDRHGLTKVLCPRKRRQSGSQVDGDEAPHAPDDLADTDLMKIEPSTSGLGVVGSIDRTANAGVREQTTH
jgi:ribosomal protein L36